MASEHNVSGHFISCRFLFQVLEKHLLFAIHYFCGSKLCLCRNVQPLFYLLLLVGWYRMTLTIGWETMPKHDFRNKTAFWTQTLFLSLRIQSLHRLMFWLGMTIYWDRDPYHGGSVRAPLLGVHVVPRGADGRTWGTACGACTQHLAPGGELAQRGGSGVQVGISYGRIFGNLYILIFFKHLGLWFIYCIASIDPECIVHWLPVNSVINKSIKHFNPGLI